MTGPSSPIHEDMSRINRRVLGCVDFSAHHSALFFGGMKCAGHPCQKQPSMNTATFARQTPGRPEPAIDVRTSVHAIAQAGGMNRRANGQFRFRVAYPLALEPAPHVLVSRLWHAAKPGTNRRVHG